MLPDDPERFEVVGGRAGVLGHGTFGVVRKAFDRNLGHEVAIKTVKLTRVDDITRSRLVRETALLQGLNHEHVIRLYESLERVDTLYLVLEVLRGSTLAKCVRCRGALTELDACRLASQMLQALVHMHSRGVIHRDLKPDNVMSKEPTPRRGPLPSDVIWKIFDFGFGRQVRKRRKSSSQRSKRGAASAASQEVSADPPNAFTDALGPTLVMSSPQPNNDASEASRMPGSGSPFILALEQQGTTPDDIKVDVSFLPRRVLSHASVTQTSPAVDRTPDETSTEATHPLGLNRERPEVERRSRTLDESELVSITRSRKFSGTSATSTMSGASPTTSVISAASKVSIGGTRGYMAPGASAPRSSSSCCSRVTCLPCLPPCSTHPFCLPGGRRIGTHPAQSSTVF